MVTLQDNTATDVLSQDHLYGPNMPYTASELSAMAYHGMLRPQFGPYYVDVDIPDTAAQRAKSVKLVGDHTIDGDWSATLLTAAWIHTGGQCPELFEATTITSPRMKERSEMMPKMLRHASSWEQSDDDQEDLLVIGGAVVTSPSRTIEDLLRIGATRRHQFKALELLPLVCPEQLRTRFAAHTQLAGMKTASQVFETLLATGKPVAQLEHH